MPETYLRLISVTLAKHCNEFERPLNRLRPIQRICPERRSHPVRLTSSCTPATRTVKWLCQQRQKLRTSSPPGPQSCILHRPQELPMLWSHVPNIALVSIPSLKCTSTCYLCFLGLCIGLAAAAVAVSTPDSKALPMPTSMSFTDASPTPGRISGLLQVSAPQSEDVTRLAAAIDYCRGLISYQYSDPIVEIRLWYQILQIDLKTMSGISYTPVYDISRVHLPMHDILTVHQSISPFLMCLAYLFGPIGLLTQESLARSKERHLKQGP